MEVTLNRLHDHMDHGHIQKSGLNKLRGITLIELVTAMAIFAITVGVGIPSVSAMIQTNRMASAMNTLSGGFALARSEAITRNREVVICTSQDGELCTRKGGWEQGWIIFEDLNGNEKRDKDEQRFRVQDALPPGIEISFKNYPSWAVNFVYYWPTGFTKMNGTLYLSANHGPSWQKR